MIGKLINIATFPVKWMVDLLHWDKNHITMSSFLMLHPWPEPVDAPALSPPVLSSRGGERGPAPTHLRPLPPPAPHAPPTSSHRCVFARPFGQFRVCVQRDGKVA